MDSNREKRMKTYRALIKQHRKDYLEKINWGDIKNLLEKKGLMPPDCREADESKRMSVLIEVTLKSNNESDLYTILTILDKQMMNMRESPITNDGDEDEYRNNASSLSTSHVKVEEDGSSDGYSLKDEMHKLSLEMKKMKKEHEQAKEEKLISDETLNSAVSTIENMKKELDALKKTNERLERKMASYEREIEEKLEKIKSLEKEIKDTKEELEKEKQNNIDKSEKIDSLEKKVNDLEKDVSDREQEVAREIVARDQDRKEYEKNLEQLREEFQKFKSDGKKSNQKFVF